MMAETNGAKPHTTVTVSTDPTVPTSLEIRLNLGYFKTVPGIIKIIELVLGVICMACASPASGVGYRIGGNIIYTHPFLSSGFIDYFGLGHNHWFLFVVVTSFIVSLIWVFYYLLQIRDYIKIKLPFTFLWLEVVYTVVATLLYVIAFIVVLAGFGWCAGQGHACDARVAAGVFAIFNSVAYGIGAWLVYQEYKATPPELQ